MQHVGRLPRHRNRPGQTQRIPTILGTHRNPLQHLPPHTQHVHKPGDPHRHPTRRIICRPHQLIHRQGQPHPLVHRQQLRRRIKPRRTLQPQRIERHRTLPLQQRRQRSTIQPGWPHRQCIQRLTDLILRHGSKLVEITRTRHRPLKQRRHPGLLQHDLHGATETRRQPSDGLRHPRFERLVKISPSTGIRHRPVPIRQFEGRRQGPRAHHRNNDVALAPLLFASVQVPPPGVYGPARG